MGGLGHVGVQIAHAMGAEVTVLSQSLAQGGGRPALRRRRYYATTDKATFKALRGRFDLILNTVSANLPMDRYLFCSSSPARWSTSALPPSPTRCTPAR